MVMGLEHAQQGAGVYRLVFLHLYSFQAGVGGSPAGTMVQGYGVALVGLPGDRFDLSLQGSLDSGASLSHHIQAGVEAVIAKAFGKDQAVAS